MFWKHTTRRYHPDPAPAGGDPPAGDAPPANDAPSKEDAPQRDDPRTTRDSAYSRYGYSDEQRQHADQLLDRFGEMDPAAQAELIAAGARALNRSDAPPRRERADAEEDDDTEKEDRKPAREEDPRDAEIKRLKSTVERLERGEHERAAKSKQERDEQQWNETVSRTLRENPALDDLDDEEILDMCAEVKGYAHKHLQTTYGGSLKKTIEGYAANQAARMERAARGGGKKLVEDKTRARAATGGGGDGRPPATTSAKIKPGDLRDGTALNEALADLRAQQE